MSFDGVSRKEISSEFFSRGLPSTIFIFSINRVFSCDVMIMSNLQKKNYLPRLPLRCAPTLNSSISMKFLCDNYVLLSSFKRKTLCHASRHAVQNKTPKQAKTMHISSDFKLWKWSKTFLRWYGSFWIAYDKNYALFWALIFRPPSLCPSVVKQTWPLIHLH